MFEDSYSHISDLVHLMHRHQKDFMSSIFIILLAKLLTESMINLHYDTTQAS